MPVSPGVIAVTPGSGKTLDCAELTVNSVTVEREVIVIADGVTPGNYTNVDSNGGVQTTPVQKGTLTDRSGTITAGGTSQTLAAINAGRKYLFVQNPSSQTESLFINFTSAASLTVGSIELLPGGSYERTLSTYMTTELISVNAATTSHPFVAKEG